MLTITTRVSAALAFALCACAASAQDMRAPEGPIEFTVAPAPEALRT